MRWAIIFMMFSWTLSIVIAVLPIAGISSYSATSTCLPIDVKTVLEKAFLSGGEN